MSEADSPGVINGIKITQYSGEEKKIVSLTYKFHGPAEITDVSNAYLIINEILVSDHAAIIWQRLS